MDVYFYNTLTHRTDRFDPIDPPQVTMYNCGLTVYDYGHIGNFRAFLFADVLRRYLELLGYRVHQVMNITDVGHMTEDQLADGGGQDKMLVAAERLKEAKKQGHAGVDDPDDPYQVAAYFTRAFLNDARDLRLKIAGEYPANVPRATEHIAQMQAMIQKLLDRDHAYLADDGAVYYHVPSFPDYGRLSGNRIDETLDGAGGRVLEEHQAVKRHPADFLLWKPDAAHIMKWDSPWGRGYPGWHIECSAMASHVLGRAQIDIHTGGEDNIFPHHECEIAQSCGATGADRFARFWMHCRHLLVDGQKMSKSQGNFFTIGQVTGGKVTGRPVDPAVLRFELIRSNYRSNMNFTAKGLQDSARAVQRLRAAADSGAGWTADLSHPVVHDFAQALADDLNMSAAVGVIFEWLKRADGGDEVAGVVRYLDTVLDILRDGSVGGVPSNGRGSATTRIDAEDLCRQMDEARANKNFAAADRLRQQLIDANYDVMTTNDGTVARPKLA